MDENNKIDQENEIFENENISADASESADETSTKKNFFKEVYDWLETVGIAFAFVLILFTFVFKIVTVDGKSMHYTLDNGDKLIISDMFYTPKNGDIVVVKNERTVKPIIKRVIATEGQVVDINFETWEISVDGKVISEDYINDEEKHRGFMLYNGNELEYPFTVSENCVFVMGDNRNRSSDSRSYGEFSREDIIGRVLLRIFPFNDFGTVKPATSERIERIKAKN